MAKGYLMKTVKLSILVVLSSLLASCNLANSADSDSPSASATAKKPSATISIQSSIPDANADGYYQERSKVIIQASATGSFGSAVTCVITVSHKANTATYTEVDILNDCGTRNIAFDSGAGVYKIKLVATDANSLVAEAQTFAIVVPNTIGSGSNLTANFTATPSDTPASTFDIALDATSSTKGETGDIDTYTWQVRKKENDSVGTLVSTVGPLNSPTTSIVVQSDGIYVVKLTIVDTGAKTTSTEKTFTVGDNGSLLSADFTVTATSPAPVNVQVDASTSSVNNIEHYAWDLFSAEDLTVSLYHVETEIVTANLPITASGIYHIRLRVIDATGNEHETTRLLQVQ
ncbi:MAG TPA: hypothetical protein DD716_02660 [Thiomicrospira sp.]|nr:hypothetical protein [Thiomicrospira sp.]